MKEHATRRTANLALSLHVLFLITVDAVPPNFPGLRKVSWWLGLFWRTRVTVQRYRSIRRALSKLLEKGDTEILMAVRSLSWEYTWVDSSEFIEENEAVDCRHLYKIIEKSFPVFATLPSDTEGGTLLVEYVNPYPFHCCSPSRQMVVGLAVGHAGLAASCFLLSSHFWWHCER